MSPLLAIASVTFREVFRRKVQVNLVLFGLLLIGASLMMSRLTIGEGNRIVADLGLSAATLISTLVAVFVGTSLVAGDIERRVLLPVIAKPASRTTYILGRYLGLASVLVVNLLVMAVGLATVLAAGARSLRPVDANLAAAILMLGVQLLVVAAVAILFSAVTTTTLAAIFTFSVTIAGHLTNDLRAIWPGEDRWIPTVLWYLLPNLGSLSLNSVVIYRTPIPPGTWFAVLYGGLFAATTLAIAAWAFERKDLR